MQDNDRLDREIRSVKEQIRAVCRKMERIADMRGSGRGDAANRALDAQMRSAMRERQELDESLQDLKAAREGRRAR